LRRWGGAPRGNELVYYSSLINHHSSLINHQSSIITHHSSIINHQSSIITQQSSLITHHSSIINHHSSIINHHSSIINHQSSLITHQSSIINHHSTIIPHHSSLITHQSSLINHQSSLINHQSSIITHQSSIINHHSSIIPHQSSLITHQSSIINHHSSIINHHSSLINHQSSFITRHSLPPEPKISSAKPQTLEQGASFWSSSAIATMVMFFALFGLVASLNLKDALPLPPRLILGSASLFLAAAYLSIPIGAPSVYATGKVSPIRAKHNKSMKADGCWVAFSRYPRTWSLSDVARPPTDGEPIFPAQFLFWSVMECGGCMLLITSCNRVGRSSAMLLLIASAVSVCLAFLACLYPPGRSPPKYMNTTAHVPPQVQAQTSPRQTGD
jgi:hypothetical protein